MAVNGRVRSGTVRSEATSDLNGGTITEREYERENERERKRERERERERETRMMNKCLCLSKHLRQENIY